MTRAQRFGTAPDGSAVHTVAIEGGGLSVRLITWGATVQDVRLAGIRHPLVLGSEDFAAYLGPMTYFGAIVGRVANRIAKGRAVLDDRELMLDRNEDGVTTLHGGQDGCASVNWRLDGYDAKSCRMSVCLPDGQAGFPGNLDIVAEFRTPGEGALEIELSATTDAATFCNLAHHGYWCLDGRADLRGHRLTVHADSYLLVDAERIPTGEQRDVSGSAFDFRKAASPVLRPGSDLDHNFCLEGEGLRAAALLETDNIALEILTTEPGLQVYNGGRLDTSPFVGLGGDVYGPFAGIALEPQGWPDAPNNPDAPSVRLDAGGKYQQLTVFRLLAR